MQAFAVSVLSSLLLISCGGGGAGAGSSSGSNSGGGVTAQGAGAPTITSVFPNPANQGDTVTMNGTNFVSGLTLVAGDGCNQGSPTFINATEITFTAQACLFGATTLRVVNPDGKASNFVTYEATKTLSIKCGAFPNPFFLSTLTGGKVGCAGNFHQDVAIFVNGISTTTSDYAPATHLQSIPLISFTAPPLPIGVYDIKIVDSDGRNQTLVGALQYGDPPTVTGMSPTSGTFVGGTTVTITGTNFTQAPPGMGVGATFVNDLGGMLCATQLSVESVTPTEIVGKTIFQGGCGPGTATVTVQTPFGSATVPQTFTFTP